MIRVFQFSSSASLEKLTGRKALNLEELLGLVKSCPSSSIFHHTFSTFRKMREAHAPYTNDFAVWIAAHLREAALGEKLMAIEPTEYNTIETLRSHLIEIIEQYRNVNPTAFEKTADEAFHLYDVVRFVYLTDKFAYNLESFRQMLNIISIDSIYYHFVESRLQTKLQTDDFSNWIEKNVQNAVLADKIRNIEMRSYTLEELRLEIIGLIDEYS